MLVFHIVAGTVALLAGFAALFSPKGGRVHRRAGTAFALAMLAMSASGAAMAASNDGPGSRISVIAGLLSFQLVASGWWTVRPAARFARVVPRVLALLAAATTLLALTMVALAIANGGRHDGLPAPAYAIFGSLAARAALGVARLLAGRRLDGRQRLARHLWRMGTAMTIATMSFFLGQADEFPAWLRHGLVSAGPPLLVLGTVLGYFVRVRWRRGAGPGRAPPQASAILRR